MCLLLDCKVCKVLEIAQGHNYTHDIESACASNPYIEWTIPETDIYSRFTIRPRENGLYSIAYWIENDKFVFGEDGDINDILGLYQKAIAYGDIIRKVYLKLGSRLFHNFYTSFDDMLTSLASIEGGLLVYKKLRR